MGHCMALSLFLPGVTLLLPSLGLIFPGLPQPLQSPQLEPLAGFGFGCRAEDPLSRLAWLATETISSPSGLIGSIPLGRVMGYVCGF